MPYRGTIICIDDEPGVLRVLRTHLESFLGESYEILLAESGEDAIEILKDYVETNRHLDMAIVDFKMPGMSGTEILEWIARHFRESKRILLTGQAGLENAIYAINQIGLYQYIEKPWNDEDLKLVVQNGLEEFYLQQENRKLFEDLKQKSLQLEWRHQESLNHHKALIQSEKMSALGKLSGGIIQDIRTRLNLLLPCAEQAKELVDKVSKKHADFKDYVNQLIDLHYSTQSMMDELIQFAKHETYQLSYSLNSINDIVSDSLKIFQWNEKFNSIECMTDLSENMDQIMCNPSSIKQSLINLISNALEAISSIEGKIKIKTYSEKAYACIEVNDNGYGLDEDMYEKVWDPFFTTKSDEHVGLGLYLVRRCIDFHHGKAECLFNEEHGTIFKLSFPYDQMVSQ